MPHLYGAVVLRSESDDPENPNLEKEAYPKMTFKVRGEPTFQYSEQALLDNVGWFDVLKEFVTAGNGGIELRNIRQASGEASDYAGLQSN